MMALATLAGRAGWRGWGCGRARSRSVDRRAQSPTRCSFRARASRAPFARKRTRGAAAVPAFVSSTIIPSAAGTALCSITDDDTRNARTQKAVGPCACGASQPQSLPCGNPGSPEAASPAAGDCARRARRDELAPPTIAGASASAAAPRAGPLSEEDSSPMGHTVHSRVDKQPAHSARDPVVALWSTMFMQAAARPTV